VARWAARHGERDGDVTILEHSKGHSLPRPAKLLRGIAWAVVIIDNAGPAMPLSGVDALTSAELTHEELP